MFLARIKFRALRETLSVYAYSRLMLRVIVFILIGFLAGCLSSSSSAPVVAIAPKSAVVRGTHTVREGESLYLIAWRYGRDFQELAMANHIEEPYRIRPGQALTLEPPTEAQKQAYLAKQQPPTKKVTVATVPKVKEKTQQIPEQTILVDKSSSWLWPTTGEVVTLFKQNPKKNKGIDIANKKGTPIKATKPGKVVYSGQGLRGYGRLLIIKHDDNYLSAYAHNDKLLVKEGQHVTQGQTIATMGRTDSNQVKLHFEIRKKGQPVNPLGYLPKNTS